MATLKLCDFLSGLLGDEEKMNGFHHAKKAADLGLSEVFFFEILWVFP